MTTREDRQADPRIRDRAIAALTYAANQHPEQRLGELIGHAMFDGRLNLYACTDAELAAALHAYGQAER